MKKEYSKEYATALFDVILEKTIDIESIYHELEIVSDTISTDSDFLKIFMHPKVSKAEKKEIINSIFNGFNTHLVHFLYVLVDNDRLEGIHTIFDSFVKLFHDYKKTLVIEAVSTEPLTNEQKMKIINKLTVKYRKKIEIKNTIDKSIIGGIRLQINDEIMDNTVINQLQNLKSYVLKQN